MSSLEKAITDWFVINKRDLPWLSQQSTALARVRENHYQ